MEALTKSDKSEKPSLFDEVLNALASPVLVVGAENEVFYVNTAGEQFFDLSSAQLLNHGLGEYLPADHPVIALLEKARREGHSITEYALDIETPRISSRNLTVEATPLLEPPGCVVLALQRESIARKLDHQLLHRNAARSVSAMAAMLAHEVKNPLSGIKGAAQLLEQDVGEEDRKLTRLISDEADRIAALVNRMEMFSDVRPVEREAVNIHEILHHVVKLARAGFGRHVSIKEVYDPSLPLISGNRDLLVQVFLNLVKNAVEAVSANEGEILLKTRYQQGLRLKLAGGGAPVDLPLVVSVQDNGPGVPEELRTHLFEPFVSTKKGGKGLGLALVAKIVGDHGGVIELESAPRRTLFRLALPKARFEDDT